MQAISQVDGEISCIPNNFEKHISFSLMKKKELDKAKEKGKSRSFRQELRFIDSAQFMLSGLDKLVDATPNENMEITAMYETDPEKRALLLRKGVYPYEYVDDWQRFDESCLPPKDAFYSTLTDSHISDEDYKHGQAVWEAFSCATLGDYHDLYLRTDVLLLADVFENFRRMCLNQ